MLIPIVVLALQVAQPAGRADADRANAAFVTCLFATARTARARSEAPESVRVNLDRACVSEERVLRRSMARVLEDRGLGRTARTKIDDVMTSSRDAVAKVYERTSPKIDIR